MNNICRVTSKAFTLVELLVVISIIALLMGILMPVLNISKAKSKQVLCQSNLRQLVLANIAYAGQNDSCYVPAALDIYTVNRHRWYGVRKNTSEAFDRSKGPLASYLGGEEIKCGQKVNFKKLPPSESVFDQGSGGYGYNMIYIGSRIWMNGYEEQSCKTTAKDTQIAKPAGTLMFADTAMAKPGHEYIEYSFAEPRYFVVNRGPVNMWSPSPSIHFRHRNAANVGWADGHVSWKKLGNCDVVNEDGVRPAKMGIGWFEPLDNSLFDLE